jgi:hypothetical protein
MKKNNYYDCLTSPGGSSVNTSLNTTANSMKKKTPKSRKKSSTAKRPPLREANRRETADPAALLSLLDGNDDSINSALVSLSENTPNKLQVIALEKALEKSRQSLCEQSLSQQSLEGIIESPIELQNEGIDQRRLTADPAVLNELLTELEEDSAMKSVKSGGNNQQGAESTNKSSAQKDVIGDAVEMSVSATEVSALTMASPAGFNGAASARRETIDSVDLNALDDVLATTKDSIEEEEAGSEGFTVESIPADVRRSSDGDNEMDVDDDEPDAPTQIVPYTVDEEAVEAPSDGPNIGTEEEADVANTSDFSVLSTQSISMSMPSPARSRNASRSSIRSPYGSARRSPRLANKRRETVDSTDLANLSDLLHDEDEPVDLSSSKTVVGDESTSSVRIEEADAADAADAAEDEASIAMDISQASKLDSMQAGEGVAEGEKDITDSVCSHEGDKEQDSSAATATTTNMQDLDNILEASEENASHEHVSQIPDNDVSKLTEQSTTEAVASLSPSVSAVSMTSNMPKNVSASDLSVSGIPAMPSSKPFNRRETVDSADLANLLENNSLGESTSVDAGVASGTNARRETVDSTDMAELMGMLEDDDEAAAKAKGSADKGSKKSSAEKGKKGSKGRGRSNKNRESIDTVALMGDVDELLNESQESYDDSVTLGSDYSSVKLGHIHIDEADKGKGNNLKNSGIDDDNTSVLTFPSVGSLQSSPQPSLNTSGETACTADVMNILGDEDLTEGSGTEIGSAAAKVVTSVEKEAPQGKKSKTVRHALPSPAPGSADHSQKKKLKRKGSPYPFRRSGPLSSSSPGSDVNEADTSVDGEMRDTCNEANESNMHASPRPSTMTSMAPPLSGLRSCLRSQTKKHLVPQSVEKPISLGANESMRSVTRASARKSVVFGSPNVAEFDKLQPSVRMTPMSKQDARTMFSMEQKKEDDHEEDEVTAENSRILDEWDRLTNTSEASDESRETNDSAGPNESPNASMCADSDAVDTPANSVKSGKSSQSGGSQRSRRRRSMLQPSISPMAYLPTDGQDRKDVSFSAEQSSLGDATVTVDLPGSLSALIEEANNNDTASAKPLQSVPVPKDVDTSAVSVSMNKSGECTEELESNLLSLMDAYTYTHASDSSKSPSVHSERSLGGVMGLPKSDEQSRSSSGRSVAGNSRADSSAMSDSTLSEVGSEGSVVSFKKRSPNPSRDRMSAAVPNKLFSDVRNGDVSMISEISCDEGHTVRVVDDGAIGEKMRSSVQAETEKDMDVDVDVYENDAADSSPLDEANRPAMKSPNEAEEKVRDAGSYMDISIGEASDLLNSTRSHGDDSTRVGSENDDHDLDTSVEFNQSRRMSVMPSMTETSFAEGRSFMNSSVRRESSAAPTVEGQNMLARLRSLNADARNNALVQCSTPMAAQGRMSIGMKRHSLNMLTGHRHMQNIEELMMSSAKKPRHDVVEQATQGVTEKTAGDEAVPVPEGTVSVVEKELASKPTSQPDTNLPKSQAESQLGDVYARLQLENPTRTDAARASNLVSFLKATLTLSDAPDFTGLLVGRALESLLLPVVEQGYQSISHMQDRDQANMNATYDLMTLGAMHTVHYAEAMRTQCVNQGISIRQKWEQHVARLLQENLSVMITRNLQCTADKDQEHVESSRVAMGAEIPALRAAIRAARERVEAKKLQLGEVNEKISNVINDRKSIAVSALTQPNKVADKVLEDSGKLVPVHDRATCAALSEEERLVGEARQALRDTQNNAAIANRLTYCRLVSYKSSEIAVSCLLTSTVRVSISFKLSTSASEGHHEITGIEVELDLKAPREAEEASAGRETMLATSYFATIMCADELKGPLSNATLASITSPTALPGLLHKVSA